MGILTYSNPEYSPPVIFTDMALQDDAVSCGYFVLHFAKVIINEEIGVADWLTEYMISGEVDSKWTVRWPDRELQRLLGGNFALKTCAMTPVHQSPFFLDKEYSLDDFKRCVLWYVCLTVYITRLIVLFACRVVHEHNEMQAASLQPYASFNDNGVVELGE
jgi:hypothetical protein